MAIAGLTSYRQNNNIKSMVLLALFPILLLALLGFIFLFLGRLALAAQRRPPVTGIDGLIGTAGQTRDPLTPDTTGYVLVRGELWRARSRSPVPSGAPIRVLQVDGLTLDVEPLPASTSHGDSAS